MDHRSIEVIQNREALATTPARAALLSIAEAGYRAIRTPQVIEDTLVRTGDTLQIGMRTYDLAEYEHVYVLAVGKCSVDAAPTIAEILNDRLTEGVFLDVRTGPAPERVRILEGTHPYPSAQNVAHTNELLALAARATDHDLVLIVISGGGSALLTAPHDHSPLEEADLIKHLFKGGATIRELNTVRKHLSRARGGNLAFAAQRATVATLIFSDVPGDDLATIASGPTVLDTTTISDAEAVLTKYHAERVGFSTSHLKETPKEGEVFARINNVLALTNRTALEAMEAQAIQLGYHATIRDTAFQGRARSIAEDIVAELHIARPRTVLLYGGESTVTITGPGKGGRNEELSLAALTALASDELVLSLASDGRDNTEFAGGIADGVTSDHARALGLAPETFLDTNDSYTFFHRVGQGVETGYTGANVADLVIGMKHERDT